MFGMRFKYDYCSITPKKKSGERTEWKYLKCSQYRRAGRHGCVNHVPIQYGDFREFILNLLMKKGESVLLNLRPNVENEQVRKEKKLKQILKQNEQRKKNLLELYLDCLIKRPNLKRNEKRLRKL